MLMAGKTHFLRAALFLAATASACSNGEKERAKIAEIQRQADERIAQAERDARQKVAAFEKQMEATKADLVDAAAQVKAEATDAISKAQASADEAAKAAAGALAKARQAYKEEGRVQLNNLSKDVTEVSAKLAKAPAKVKTAVSTAMQKVTTEQKAISKDITAFDTATLDTFKAAKAQLDKDIAALKSAIKAARAKLP
jgi:hypothetical protein